jgi:hypothetical protein
MEPRKGPVHHRPAMTVRECLMGSCWHGEAGARLQMAAASSTHPSPGGTHAKGNQEQPSRCPARTRFQADIRSGHGGVRGYADGI